MRSSSECHRSAVPRHRAGVQINCRARICASFPRCRFERNIRVTSIIDRFSSTPAFFRFPTGGAGGMGLDATGSCNFLRRIDDIPIRMPPSPSVPSATILSISWPITSKLDPRADALPPPNAREQRALRSGDIHLDRARDSVSVGPYEESIRHPARSAARRRREKALGT